MLFGCSQGGQPQQSGLARALQSRGRIAFVGPDGNVQTADQSGGNGGAITADAGPGADRRAVVRYSLPTWAGGSRRIAFARTELTRSAVTTEIVVSDATVGRGAEAVWRSSDHRFIYLSWSPDGRKITLLSEVLTQPAQLELGLIDVAAGSYSALVVGQPYYWAWLPDSQTLLSHVGGDSRQSRAARLQLVVADPAAKGAGEAVGAPYNLRLAAFQSPAVTPDGQHMVLVTAEGNRARLALRTVHGGEEYHLADVSGLAYFDIAPSGRYVAVLQTNAPAPTAASTLSLYDIRDRGRREQDHTPPPSSIDQPNALAFFWSPNSRQIAYLAPAQPENGQLTIESMFAIEQPIYLELRVADVGTGQSRALTVFPVTEEYFRNVLPFFDQYQRSATIWSPNSRYVTFSAMTSGGFPGVFVIASNGRFRPDFVAPGDLPFWSRR